LSRRPLRWLAPLAAATLLLAAVVAHLASSRPDGLERVAEKMGFAQKERGQEQAAAHAPMPEYELFAWRGPLGKTTASVLGVLLTFGLVVGVGRLLARRRRPREAALRQLRDRPGGGGATPGPPA
jgi:hypothetical protein